MFLDQLVGSKKFILHSRSKCNKLTKSNVLVFLISILSMVNFCRALANDLNFVSKSNYPHESGEWISDLKKPTHSHHLYRRVASTMVPIRDREKTSICTYRVVTDVNVQRIPDKIDRVLCRKDSCKCADQGDFRCTQLYAQLNVTYLTNDFKLSYEFELINVEYGCVCSRAPGGSNVNLFEPLIV